jgi:hypothetical protein
MLHGLFNLTIILVIAMFYFMPAITAITNGKRNASAIFALNLLLGWTLIGWVLALVWSLTKDAQFSRDDDAGFR